MPMRCFRQILLSAPVLLAVIMCGPARGAVSWKTILDQPSGWYGAEEAVRIAERVLAFQLPSGGWTKNIDLAADRSAEERAQLLRRAAEAGSTIDNGATTRELRFLARVYRAHPDERWAEAIRRGVDYLLQAQYPNGGWPQFYPLIGGYHDHITYNDDAMIRVLRLLRDVACGAPDFAFRGAEMRQRAAEAVERGVACILATQVVVDGEKTVWCAQHDAETLAPAPARKYEPISLSGVESVEIVRFLMELDDFSPAIVEAVEGAVAWFERTAIRGFRYEFVDAPGLPGGRDRVLVPDPEAGPLWARFYDIETQRPIFLGRDSVVHERLSEIEHERRVGYRWYSGAAAGLLARDLPRWRWRRTG
ncbi:MAG: pectate lyase, partial [Verrucomicrobia bacterium]